MDNATEKSHQQSLMTDQRFIMDFRELNGKKPEDSGWRSDIREGDAKGLDRATRYCLSIENQAIAAIQNGNLPEVSFQLDRLRDVNGNTLGKVCAVKYVERKREGFLGFGSSTDYDEEQVLSEDAQKIGKHQDAINNIGRAPVDQRNYRIKQFLADRNEDYKYRYSWASRSVSDLSYSR